jgi:FkbM family methyltransferase
MLDFFARRRVASFETIMKAYRDAGVLILNCLDGGAGSGSTSRHMLKHCSGDVCAFEPFPGNHKFFANAPERIRLMPVALAAEPGTCAFRVTSVVQEDSEWGRKGMAGYSSVGFLTAQPKETDLAVRCVRADDEIDVPIDFVKLDLQGGELNALKGMPRIASECLFMWVEYSGQAGLLDLLERDFDLYDTEYFFHGEPLPAALELFEPSRQDITLSTGKKAWFGYRRTPWGEDYEAEIALLRKQIKLVQTDLVCINRRKLAEFQAASQRIAG